MTTIARTAELDSIIESLQADLDSCPSSMWTSERNQARLDLLIEYTSKRDAMVAAEVASDDEAETTTPDHGFSEDRNMTTSDSFTDAYVKTALWSSTDDDGEPLDSNHSVEDIAPETLALMVADCEDFRKSFGALLANDPERAAHDFWLTRNGHGAGFWDGDWSQPYPANQIVGEPDEAYEFRSGGTGYKTVGDFLAAMSKPYGEFTLYVGDDGMIHGS